MVFDIWSKQQGDLSNRKHNSDIVSLELFLWLCWDLCCGCFCDPVFDCQPLILAVLLLQTSLPGDEAMGGAVVAREEWPITTVDYEFFYGESVSAYLSLPSQACASPAKSWLFFNPNDWSRTIKTVEAKV